MPNTYYVATDGNDGTAVVNNPALPWATLSPIEVICANGDTIEFADGAYNAATLATNFTGNYIYMIDKAVTLKATNAGNVTFSFTDTIWGIRYQGAWGGLTSAIEGIRFIAEAGVTAQYQIGIKNTSGTAGTLNITNCVFEDESFYTLWMAADSAFGMNVNVSDCSFRGATTTGSAIRFRDLVTGTALVINNCAFEANSPSVPQNLIDVDAAAAGCSLSVTNSTLYSTTATSSNVLISCINIDEVVIDNCTLTADTSATAPAYGIHIKCDDATLSANNAVVSNNVIYQNSSAGHGILIGLDGTSQGETDKSNDGLMFNNTLTCNALYRAGGGHGMMFGYNTNGNSVGNKINSAGVGLLCKKTTGGGHFANLIKNFGDPGGSGAAILSKGATSTKYYGNTIEVTADSYGSAFLANANTDPSGNNTTVEFESNIFKVSERSATITLASTVDASQDVTFKKNVYINTDEAVAANATPFSESGTGVSVATWIANVEDDAYNKAGTLSLALAAGGTGEQSVISHNIIKH
jgi:hypothetical protein